MWGGAIQSEGQYKTCHGAIVVRHADGVTPFTMVALKNAPALNSEPSQTNDTAETPAFHTHPVAPGQYSIPAIGDDLVLPIKVIEEASTLENDQEAKELVTSHAAAVYTDTRKGRLVAAQHHRD